MATTPIKASINLQKRIRKARLTARQLVFADLLNIGYEQKDAYQLSGLYDTILVPAENWKNMKALIQDNEAFANYIPPYKLVPPNAKVVADTKPTPKQQRTNEPLGDVLPPATPSHTITDEEMQELLSKDNQLKELLWKLKHESLDTPTELKVRQMIADLTNAKKEQTQVDDKRAMFYLPLKCYQCSLFLTAKKKQHGTK